jgi:uncharacterized protein
MDNKEIRIITEDEFEIRIAPDSRKVEGTGIVFNRLSEDLGGFQEIILPESIDGVVEKSDVLALLNHDSSRGLLARSIKNKGSLKLESDTNALRYSFDSPKYPLGDELIEGIKRGDIKGSSFAFTVADEEWDWKRKPIPLRTIKKIDMLYDVSPCYRPAYADTTVALRNLDKLKEEHKTEIEELETKPVTEEPVIEPIVERTEPVIDPVEWYRKQKKY